MRIYVNNLHYQTTEKQLRDLFEAFGRVNSAKIKNNRIATARAIFGFIEMENADDATAAIAKLHNTILNENTLQVEAANINRSNKWRFKN